MFAPLRRSALLAAVPVTLALGAAVVSAWTPVPAAPRVVAGTYAVDAAHSTVGFRVRHLGISTVSGNFNQVEGAVTVPRANTLAGMTATGTIQAASINTNNERRDTHLRSADFFETERYPTITFATRSVRAGAGNRFTLAGTLTMHGVTRPVTLAGTFDGQAGTKIALTAEGVINRSDYGLTWNRAVETGGVVVSDQVTLVLNVEADRAPARR